MKTGWAPGARTEPWGTPCAQLVGGDLDEPTLTCCDRSVGSGVIQVFVNFKMAAGGHLVFEISRFPVWDLLRV